MSKFINEQTLSYLKSKQRATNTQRIETLEAKINGEIDYQYAETKLLKDRLHHLGKAVLTLQEDLTTVKYAELLAKSVSDQLAKKVRYLTAAIITLTLGGIACLIKSLI